MPQTRETLLAPPFAGNGGDPDPFSVRQDAGRTMDCWFVSAMVGLAKQRPDYLKTIIRPEPPRKYVVTLFGSLNVAVEPLDDLPPWSSSNGPWASLLERAYAQFLSANGYRSGTLHQCISRGNGFPSEGINALTGHRVDTDWLWWTRDKTTRRKVSETLAGRRIVTAVTGFWQSKVEPRGLLAQHVYTLLDYDPKTDRVQLRNPWGGGRGYDAGTQPPDGPDDGVFWMSLPEFTRGFRLISYELDR